MHNGLKKQVYLMFIKLLISQDLFLVLCKKFFLVVRKKYGRRVRPKALTDLKNALYYPLANQPSRLDSQKT